METASEKGDRVGVSAVHNGDEHSMGADEKRLAEMGMEDRSCN